MIHPLYKALLQVSSHRYPSKADRLRYNNEAVALIKQNKEVYTEEDKAVLRKYTGYGSIAGDADEYYTPKSIARASHNFLNAKAGDVILDPSVGTGVFSDQANNGVKVIGCDLNKTSAKIADILNDNSEIKPMSFEEFQKDIAPASLDGVITNVPFGARDSKYRTMDMPSISTNEDYFIIKSLQIIKAGKRGVFLTTSSTAQRKGKDRADARKKMLHYGAFVGGVRLPSETFKATGTEQVVDILVFERHPQSVVDAIENDKMDWATFEEHQSKASRQFIEGVYFDKNNDSILGDFISREDRIAQAEASGESLHHMAQRDIVKLKDGMTLDDVKQKLLKRSDFKNLTDYDKMVTLIGETKVMSAAQTKLLEEAKEALLEEAGRLLDKDLSGILSDKDFINYYDEAFPLELGQTNNAILFARYTAISNKHRDVLMKLMFDGMADVEFITSHKDEIEDIRKKDVKIIPKDKKGDASFVISMLQRISKLDLSTGEIIKNINDLLVDDDVFSEKERVEADSYTPSYKEDGFSKDELLSDEVFISGGGEVVTMDSFLVKSDGKNYHKVVNEIQEMKNPSTVISDEEFEKKRERMLQTLEARKHTVDIDRLVLTPKLIEKINRRMLSDVHDALSRNKTMENKLRTRMEQDAELLGIFKPSDISQVVGNMLKYGWYREFVAFYTRYSKSRRYFDSNIMLPASSFISEKDADNDVGVNSLKSSILATLSGFYPILQEILNSVIFDDKEYKREIEEWVENNSVIVHSSTEGERQEKMTELDGLLNQKMIDMARHYQNSDARKFATELSGTIAQDTGLGKSLTGLMAALKAIRSGTARRPAIIVPNAVFDKWKDDVIIPSLSKQMIEKTAFISSKDKEAMRKLGRDKKIRLVVMPDSALTSQYRLKDETTDFLYGNNTKDENTGEAEMYRYPLKTSVGKYPTWKSSATNFFEDTGIDALFIDEGHRLKNAVTAKTAAKGLNSGAGSAEMRRILYFGEYIKGMLRQDWKGVVLLTATPETSSPSEIYTNMILSAPRRGMISAGIMDMEDFEDTFLNIEQQSVLSVNQSGYITKDVLTGLKNIQLLKQAGHDKILYRTAEEEQLEAKSRGYTITVKPENKTFKTNIAPTPDSEATFDALAKANKIESGTASTMRKKGTDGFTGEDVLIAKTYGEVFGFISKARGLGVSKSTALGYTSFSVPESKKDEAIEAVSKIVVPAKETIRTKYGIEVDTKAETTVKGYFESDYFIELSSRYPELALKIYQDGKINIPSQDYDVTKKVIKALEGIKIKQVDMFNIDDYPKYKELIVKIGEEIERKTTSKQIIYSIGLSTHYIIEALIKKHIPKHGKIWHYNGTTAKGDKGYAIQVKFNGADGVNFMIYGRKGEVGVDFNKNVSAVHLMDLPETPDAHHQAAGRAVRQGNVVEPVHVYKYYQGGSFDSFLDELISNKQSWIDAVKSGGDTTKFISDDLKSIADGAERMFQDSDMTIDEKIAKYIEIKRGEEKAKEDDLKDILADTIKSSISRLKNVKDNNEFMGKMNLLSDDRGIRLPLHTIVMGSNYELNNAQREATNNYNPYGYRIDGYNSLTQIITRVLYASKATGKSVPDNVSPKTLAEVLASFQESDTQALQSTYQKIADAEREQDPQALATKIFNTLKENGERWAEQDMETAKNIDEVLDREIAKYASSLSERYKNGLTEKEIIDNYDELIEISDKLYTIESLRKTTFAAKKGWHATALYHDGKIAIAERHPDKLIVDNATDDYIRELTNYRIVDDVSQLDETLKKLYNAIKERQ